jgi:type VI secretion system secreted protein VgrG
MALKQASRLLFLNTPLGKDVLELIAFSGHEEISRLFHFHLDMISDNNAISAAQIVGKNVTFGVKLPDDTPRFFNGIVSCFSAGDEDRQGRRNYWAEVVPWLWFLTRTSDCRIFQTKTAAEIIQQIFQDLGFNDYKLQLQGSPPQREYCVQYRETDFNFVSRLMEEEGIFYFFRHEDGKHTLEMANQKNAYTDCQESEVDYPRDVGTRAVKDHITSWEHRYEFRTGKISQTDYNFEDHPARNEPTPSKLMMTSQSTTVKLDNIQKYEFYDYPGTYAKKDQGDAYTKVRMEEEEVEHDVVQAASTCRTFTPGGKFKIKSHLSKSEEGKKYAIISIDHSAVEPGAYETGAPAGDEYKNTFSCLPESVTFRPPRLTLKPVIHGAQTAVVSGPGGEEIYPDKYGRVKVQFFWDREGKSDDKSSCWIRCAQSIAGKNWGAIYIPRIGQEVVVHFLEGNPDRPLVTGVVYNADQMPPYALPGNKTQSGIKSRSSLGGSGANFNEIRLEDKKGSEQIMIHAEKNQDIEVENDETHWVGHDRTKTIDHDETTHVKHDRTETVDNNETITIHGNRTETVDKNESITIGGGRTENVAKDEGITIAGGRTENVSKNESITIGGGRTENVAKDESITIGGGRTENVAKDESITIGGGRTENVAKDESITIGGGCTENVAKNDSLTVGKVLAITAGDAITITTGKASITMKKDGTISISGKDISLTGSGKIVGKASKDMVLKGQKILQN